MGREQSQSHCTGWHIMLAKTSHWHWSESCVFVKGPYTKTQLSHQCQREVLDELLGHPVHSASALFQQPTAKISPQRNREWKWKRLAVTTSEASVTKLSAWWWVYDPLITPRASNIQGDPIGRRLGCVDLYFECSTVCPILPRLWRIWQKWLCRWARWWNIQIKVNPTQVYDQLGHPVL